MAMGDITLSSTDGTQPTFPCGGCGGSEPGCCLYPFPSPSDSDSSDYPSSDLPTTITGYFADGSTSVFTLTSPYTYTDSFGRSIYQLGPPDNFWEMSNLTGRTPEPSNCLITNSVDYPPSVSGGIVSSPFNSGTSDMFSDTYSDGTDTLTRGNGRTGIDFDLCFWSNTYPLPEDKTISYYQTGTILTDPFLTTVTLAKPTYVYELIGIGYWVKADPQSDPTGVYTNITTGFTVTIS